MKQKNYLFLTFLLFFCQNIWGADSTDWESEYKNLCTYDSKFCSRVKNSDGTFAKPKKEIVALLKELAPFIQKSAKDLGIDPRAIAGSIMAENSLNVGISDDVQNLLVKIGVANKGEILGKKFSYGLGQLNFAAAREAENYAATLENRKPMSDRDLQDAILIPEKSVYLVGAVIRKVQDDYKKQGFDISDKPEILTTLYNLGRSEEKAQETKQSGKLPRPNFFGFFVNKYISDLSFLKKSDASSPVTSKTASASGSFTASPSSKDKVASTPASGSAISSPDMSKKVMRLAFTKSVPLYSSPPTCAGGQDYGTTNLEKKYNTMKAFSVTGIAEKEKTFTVIAPSVDCETNAWQLIKVNTGEIGWVKKTDLEKNTSKTLVSDNKCKQTVDTKCLAKVNEKLKNLSLSIPLNDKNNVKGSEVFAKPFSNSEKVSFGKPDWACRDKSAKEPSYGGGVGGGIGIVVAPPVIAKDSAPKNKLSDLHEMLNEISAKENEIELRYKQPLTDPKNPYYSVGFFNLKLRMNNCLNKQKYNLTSCQLNRGVLKDLLSGLKFDERLSREDKELLNINFVAFSAGRESLYTKDEVQAIKKANGGFFDFNVGGGFGSEVNGQYQLKDGDENKWNMKDVQEAIKECYSSIDKIQKEIKTSDKVQPSIKKEMAQAIDGLLKQSIKPASETITELLKMDDEKRKKSWEDIQPFLIPLSKMCLALDDLFQLENDKVQSEVIADYKCYFNGLNIIETQHELMLKEIVRESMYSLDGVWNLSLQFQGVFSPFIPMSLGIIPGQFPNYGGMPNAEPVATYCPNKTAEQIEDIINSNPCVQRVYVPDKWLLNRLNELGDKVMFKPFAEDDRYSFDLESTQCN